MALSNVTLTATQSGVSDAEYQRLQSVSSSKCASCGGPMTVGDHEASGICSPCYWKAVDQYPDTPV